MTKPQLRQRPARAAQGRRTIHKDGAPGQELFPPLTTSLKAFIKGGSDAALRRLIYDLTSLFNQMMRNRKSFAAYIGVTEAQLLMMTIIAESRGSTVGQVAQQLNVSSQFVTIEIGTLVKKGIVAKQTNEADRRSALLNLTAKGRRLLCELAPLRCKVNDIHWRSLTEERAQILQEIVVTLISDGKSALHELEAPELRGLRAPSAQI